MLLSFISTIFMIVGFTSSNLAYAWNGYAHEKISAAALELLRFQRHPLSAALEPHTGLLLKLSTVPDVEWRGKTRNPSILIRAKRKAAAKPIKAAPVEPARDLEAAAPQELSPSRVLQLYDLSVEALRAGDPKRGLLYMGVLSSYLGDMAEPLRSASSRDGEDSPLPARGVYSVVEGKVFSENHPAVSTVTAVASELLGAKGLDGFARDRIVPEILLLIQSSQSEAEGLVKNFAEACRTTSEANCEGEEKEASDELVTKFLSIPNTVTILKGRLGEASLLLARIWASIYEAAAKPALENQAALQLEDLKLTENHAAWITSRKPTASR